MTTDHEQLFERLLLGKLSEARAGAWGLGTAEAAVLARVVSAVDAGTHLRDLPASDLAAVADLADIVRQRGRPSPPRVNWR